MELFQLFQFQCTVVDSRQVLVLNYTLLFLHVQQLVLCFICQQVWEAYVPKLPALLVACFGKLVPVQSFPKEDNCGC